MIQLDSVTYAYPESSTKALDNISAEVHEGELAVLTGNSGSGKSTLLRTMNGLVPHFYGGKFGGRVTIDGHSTLTSLPRDLAEKVGFVGQDPEDHSVVDTVEAEIAFTLENLGADPSTTRKRIEEVLDALAIASLRDRSIDTLSGGGAPASSDRISTRSDAHVPRTR